MTDIAVVCLMSNLDRSHTQSTTSSIYLKETFECRVDIQVICKNVWKNQKIYTKCKSEKISEADSAPRNRS